jgi:hypothetical protein
VSWKKPRHSICASGSARPADEIGRIFGEESTNPLQASRAQLGVEEIELSMKCGFDRRSLM